MKLTSSLLALAGSTLAANASLVLSAIYDGSGSTPKGIEIHVTSTGSYDGWTVETEFNEGTSFTVGHTFGSAVYDRGDYIYLTSTASDPTLNSLTGPVVIISDGSFTMNGDDRIRITDGTTTIDQYGASATDGSGTAWEYTDSFAVRKSGTTATGSFAPADWNTAPVNTLDPGNAPLSSALASYSPVPESTASFLAALGTFILLRRRHR